MDIVFFPVSLQSFSQVFLDGHTVEENITLDGLEVLDWVSSDVISSLKSIVVESGGVDSFANWDSLLYLGNSSNGKNDSSDSIRSGSLSIFIIDGSFKLLDCSVENKKGLIFFTNALKKRKEVEISTVGLE